MTVCDAGAPGDTTAVGRASDTVVPPRVFHQPERSGMSRLSGKRVQPHHDFRTDYPHKSRGFARSLDVSPASTGRWSGKPPLSVPILNKPPLGPLRHPTRARPADIALTFAPPPVCSYSAPSSRPHRRNGPDKRDKRIQRQAIAQMPRSDQPTPSRSERPPAAAARASQTPTTPRAAIIHPH